MWTFYSLYTPNYELAIRLISTIVTKKLSVLSVKNEPNRGVETECSRISVETNITSTIQLRYARDQQEKIIQLYKMLSMRHCTILIGSTGAGKSVIINTLIKAQQEMGVATKLMFLNPKVRKSTLLKNGTFVAIFHFVFYFVPNKGLFGG